MTYAKGEGGRLPGSRNKLSEIRDKFGDSFELTGGLDALVKWGKEHRGQYYKLLARSFPKEIHGSLEVHPHEDFIKRCIEEDAKKKLEAGQPIKMIDTQAVEMGSNGQKEASSGEDTSQKT